MLSADVEINLDRTGKYSETVQKFRDGQYAYILKEDFTKRIFAENTTDETKTLDGLLYKNITDLFESASEDEQIEREFELLLVAVTCLQLFVQNNWLGPRPSEIAPVHILPEQFLGQKISDFLETELSVDGEPIYNLTAYPEYLYIARFILLECRDRFCHLKTADWWLMRCVKIHQQVLDNKSNTLRETLIQLIDSVQKTEPLMTDDRYRELQVQFHVEAGYLSHMFYRYREAHDHFNTAKKLSGINVELTGAMGKRTRFQVDDTAQLLLEVTRCTDNTEGETCTQVQVSKSKTDLPKNLNLDDDTILDSINFKDKMAAPTQVTATEQALILGLMEDYRRSRASHDTLTEEEVQAYLTFILVQVKSWSVSMAALLLRSKLEKGSRRRVERSMRQLEELFNQTMREEPTAGQRLHLFYATQIVPVWDIQRQLAELLLSLGAIGSALEIYEQLEMWEEAIACYQRLGKTEKAETVIREQLAIKETPNLWCFLGDITRNIEHYNKAWELSNHKSARAQRCMGYLYFAKEEYEKCLECFETSLRVNALQVPVWFTYGCAAMAAKNCQLAVKAFKRCVAIDYDNFEAWNNLASAYVKLGEKKKAFMTFNDAIKCNFENWRIWENYLLVGTDCGEFSEVLRAYHRLIDLKDKWVDEQVLGVLVRAVTEKIPDADGQPAQHIEPKLRELFGRVTAKVTDKAEIWRLYAQLCTGEPEKMLQFLQKAHRCVMQTSNWEKDIDQCKTVAEQSIQLADTYTVASNASNNSTQSLQMMSSAKLMLKGVLTKIKQQHTDPITQTMPSEELVKMCSELAEKLDTVIKTIEQLKAT